MAMKRVMVPKGSSIYFTEEKTFDISTNSVGLRQIIINDHHYIVPEQVAGLIDGLIGTIDKMEKEVAKAHADWRKQLKDKSVHIAAALMGGNENRKYGENLLKNDFYDKADIGTGYERFYSQVIDRVQKAIADEWTLKERGGTVEHTTIDTNKMGWRE